MHRYFSDSFWWLVFLSLSLSLLGRNFIFFNGNDVHEDYKSKEKKKKKTVQPAVCVGVCLPCTTVDLLKVDETTTTIQKWERNKRGEWVNAKTWPKGENDWRSPAQLHPNGLHPYECDPISLVNVSFPFFLLILGGSIYFFFSSLFIWLVPNLRQWVD